MGTQLSTIRNLSYVEGGFATNHLGKRINVKESAYRFFYHRPYANDWAKAKVKAHEKNKKG